MSRRAVVMDVSWRGFAEVGWGSRGWKAPPTKAEVLCWFGALGGLAVSASGLLDFLIHSPPNMSHPWNLWLFSFFVSAGCAGSETRPATKHSHVGVVACFFPGPGGVRGAGLPREAPRTTIRCDARVGARQFSKHWKRGALVFPRVGNFHAHLFQCLGKTTLPVSNAWKPEAERVCVALIQTAVLWRSRRRRP